jgi:hypothetical protein
MRLSVTANLRTHFRPTEIWFLMDSLPAYHVVGVRADGERVVIYVNASQEVADKVMNLIRNGMDFKELRIEVEEKKSS